MLVELNMPKFGMTMKEGTIVKWFKQTGDFVAKDEPILEVETEKITNMVDSPVDGVLEKILYPEGETVAISVVIAYIDETASAGKAASGQIASGPAAEPAAAEDTVKVISETKPYSGLRKTIGERMSESLRKSPQGTMTTRADMTEIIALKSEWKAKGQSVTYTDILVKVVGLALERNPILNASNADGKILVYRSVNIGIGVGTDHGLYVPVIRNVQTKTVLEISAELKALTQKVKEDRLTADDMKGGTFTVSNLGMFDVDIVTAIINPPEAAILSIGTTRKELVVADDESTEVRSLTTLSLTADHSVMDGVPVMRFLADMKEIMKNPRQYLKI